MKRQLLISIIFSSFAFATTEPYLKLIEEEISKIKIPPQSKDGFIYAEKVKMIDKKVTYTYLLSMEKLLIQSQNILPFNKLDEKSNSLFKKNYSMMIKPVFVKNFKLNMCANSGVRDILSKDVPIVAILNWESGENVLKYELNKEDCE